MPMGEFALRTAHIPIATPRAISLAVDHSPVHAVNWIDGPYDPSNRIRLGLDLEQHRRARCGVHSG
jgi:hypothetical protein